MQDMYHIYSFEHEMQYEYSVLLSRRTFPFRCECCDIFMLWKSTLPIAIRL